MSSPPIPSARESPPLACGPIATRRAAPHPPGPKSDVDAPQLGRSDSVSVRRNDSNSRFSGTSSCLMGRRLTTTSSASQTGTTNAARTRTAGGVGTRLNSTRTKSTVASHTGSSPHHTTLVAMRIR